MNKIKRSMLPDTRFRNTLNYTFTTADADAFRNERNELITLIRDTVLNDADLLQQANALEDRFTELRTSMVEAIVKMMFLYGNGNLDFHKMMQVASTMDLSDVRDSLHPLRDELDKFGHQYPDFIVQCSFDQDDCNRCGKTTVSGKNYT